MTGVVAHDLGRGQVDAERAVRRAKRGQVTLPVVVIPREDESALFEELLFRADLRDLNAAALERAAATCDEGKAAPATDRRARRVLSWPTRRAPFPGRGRPRARPLPRTLRGSSSASRRPRSGPWRVARGSTPEPGSRAVARERRAPSPSRSARSVRGPSTRRATPEGSTFRTPQDASGGRLVRNDDPYAARDAQRIVGRRKSGTPRRITSHLGSVIVSAPSGPREYVSRRLGGIEKEGRGEPPRTPKTPR